MRPRNWLTRAAFVPALLAALGAGGGCGGKPWFAESFKQPNSYDLKGEQVEIRMLTKSDLQSFRIEGADGKVEDPVLAAMCKEANKDVQAFEVYRAGKPEWERRELPAATLQIQDLREFAACVAGKKDPDFSLEHDLAVQEALLKASGMTK